MADPAPPPKISIVTPSYNQGGFLRDTLRSILNQEYPNLETIVMDGGSTDNSVEVIREFEDRLTHWRSEPDQGQYDAIQKGMDASTGEVMAWLNSDDMYFPWTLRVVGDIFARFPEVEWISTLRPGVWSRDGVPFHFGKRPGFCEQFFFKGLYLSDGRFQGRWCIQQESTFWRRSLWERTGARLSTTEKLAGDFELWARFIREAPLVGVDVPLAGFRVHGDQRSLLQREDYMRERREVIQRMGGTIETGARAWVRRNRLGRRWPLRVAPSQGFIQPAKNIRMDPESSRLMLRNEWIFD